MNPAYECNLRAAQWELRLCAELPSPNDPASKFPARIRHLSAVVLREALLREQERRLAITRRRGQNPWR